MATSINDLVLVHIDNKPGFYARIEDVVPDVKPGWWQVKLLVLTVPLEVYTWILEEEQINGKPYTMGGTPVRMEKVESPLPKREVPPARVEEQAGQDAAREQHDKGKVVSIFDRKKKD